MKIMQKDDAQALATKSIVTFFQSMDELNANLIIVGTYHVQAEGKVQTCSVDAEQGNLIEVMDSVPVLMKRIGDAIREDKGPITETAYYLALMKSIEEIVFAKKEGKET